MAYTYRVIGLADKFLEFNELLTNKLTESGIEIVQKTIQQNYSEFKVKTQDESGWIRLATQGPDIIASFDTEKSVEKKSLEAARVGLRFLSTVITGGSILDATIYSAEESFNYALSGSGGALASSIASSIKSTESEIRNKLSSQVAPAQESIEESEFNTRLVDVESRLLSLREEVEILKQEGKDVKGVELRLERVESLVNEAKQLKESGNVLEALARLTAAGRLLDRAESALSMM